MQLYSLHQQSLGRRMLVFVGALLLTCVGNLFAQGKSSTGGMPLPEPMPTLRETNLAMKAEFSLLDGNNDRQISKDEFQNNAPKAIAEAERLAKARKHKPHMVSRLYTRNLGAKKFPEFSDIDTNGDGVISFYTEFLKFSQVQFDEFSMWDLDGNGKVTVSELLTSERQQHEKQVEAYAKAAKGGVPEGVDRPDAEIPPARLTRQFKLYDQNNDGEVTWGEVVALNDSLPPAMHDGANAMWGFLSADKNNDGIVSRDEFLSGAAESGDDFLVMKQNVFRIRDLDGDGTLSFSEYIRTGENLARSFRAYDQDKDGVLLFDDMKGAEWVAGKSIERDRCHFARLDADQDERVTWKEYRSISARNVAFGALDHLDIDNSISKKEWDAVEKEYLAGQKGERISTSAASHYAVWWFEGIFDLVTFSDIDADKDGVLSWKEFDAFPK